MADTPLSIEVSDSGAIIALTGALDETAAQLIWDQVMEAASSASSWAKARTETLWLLFRRSMMRQVVILSPRLGG